MKAAGLFSAIRIRIGGVLMLMGAKGHLALVDLAFFVEPRLAADQQTRRRIRPWVGLLIVGLLLAGLVLVGEAGIWAVHEAAPHRESRP